MVGAPSPWRRSQTASLQCFETGSLTDVEACRFPARLNPTSTPTFPPAQGYLARTGHARRGLPNSAPHTCEASVLTYRAVAVVPVWTTEIWGVGGILFYFCENKNSTGIESVDITVDISTAISPCTDTRVSPALPSYFPQFLSETLQFHITALSPP